MGTRVSLNNNHGTLNGTAEYINNPIPQIGYGSVNLDKPVDNAMGLWVRYNITGGNATQNSDYFASLGGRSTGEQPFNGIIILNKEESGKIYFTAIPDAIKEGNETVNITLTPYNFDGKNTEGSYGRLGEQNNSNYLIDTTKQTATITINDNSIFQPGIIIKNTE